MKIISDIDLRWKVGSGGNDITYIKLGAQAQLEADLKDYEAMLVTKNIQIDTLQEVHKEVIKSLFEEIEAKDYYGGADEVAIVIEKAGWQSLKQKYGGE